MAGGRARERCARLSASRGGGPSSSARSYGVAQILQTAGLAHTPASVSGFITGMYVVVYAAARRRAAADPDHPAHLGRRRSPPPAWRVLTLDGLSVGYGEAITLVAAVLYALHIVALGAWANAREALGISIVQLLVIAAICLVATAPDGIVLPDNGRDWLSVVYMALVAGALAAGRPDLGAVPPAPDPQRHRDEHGAGLRRVLRRHAGRRVGHGPDGAPEALLVLAAMLVVEARTPPQGGGRGPAPRGERPQLASSHSNPSGSVVRPSPSRIRWDPLPSAGTPASLASADRR